MARPDANADSEGRALARACGWFAAALSLGLAALTGAWWMDSGRFLPSAGPAWAPAELRALGAERVATEGALELHGLLLNPESPPHLRPLGGAVVTAGAVDLDAADYSHFVCRCRLSDADADVAVFWRTAAAPGALHRAELEPGFGGMLRPLSDHPDWRGRVRELGIVIEAEPDSHVRIESIGLKADSAWTRLEELVSAWAVFRPWRGYSINTPHLEASYRAFRMVPALAAVTLLALVLHAAWSLSRGRRPDGVVLLLVLVLGWLALDARWTLKLARQNAETLRTYAGLNRAEREALQPDAPLRAFAERILASLPDGEQRIYLLSDQPDNWYLHLRTTWYLLPHRVIDFRRQFWPMSDQAEAGDYVLALAEMPDLEYLHQERLLLWKGKGKQSAEPILRDDIGVLYRITEDAP